MVLWCACGVPWCSYCVFYVLCCNFTYSWSWLYRLETKGISKDFKLDIRDLHSSDIIMKIMIYVKVSLSCFIQMCIRLWCPLWQSEVAACCFMWRFQKICTEQLKTLVSSKCWDAVIRYVVMSWKYVYQLPNWDDPAHNKTKLSCFRYLAAQCLTAITSAPFTSSELSSIRQKWVIMW